MKKIRIDISRFYFRWLLKVVSILLLLIIGDQLVYGQKKTASEYQVKAVFLYNFTQFVDWPSTTFNSPNDPFIIGILGDDPFGSTLDEIVTGEKFGTHPIHVQRYPDLKSMGTCHMLYIHATDEETLKKIIVSVADKNILTIGEDPNFCKWGGIVRFYTENNKIRLQINAEHAKASALIISSKLLSVAKANYSKG